MDGDEVLAQHSSGRAGWTIEQPIGYDFGEGGVLVGFRVPAVAVQREQARGHDAWHILVQVGSENSTPEPFGFEVV